MWPLLFCLFVAEPPPIELTEKETDKLILQLDSDEFAERQSASDKLGRAILNERTPFVFDKLKVATKDKSLEVRMRAESLCIKYFEDIPLIDLPIWHLPRERRYVDKEDVALKYYRLARKHCLDDLEERDAYNQKVLMRMATRMYLMDLLADHKATRKEIKKIAEQTQSNWEQEYDYANEYFIGYIDWGAAKISKPPAAFEDRIKKIKEYIDNRNEPDVHIPLEELVLDHDWYNSGG